MAKTNNLKDFLMDLADAIREKEGSNETINPQDFSNRIKALSGGGNEPSKQEWTGHADAEGLRAIGWTEEDIAYYQENGVNWNEEDDDLHKVTDDNKALYGVLSEYNISTYRDRIVYLPKINITKTTMSNLFQYCKRMIAIPRLDTSSVTIFMSLFYGCESLITIPPLDTSKATTMYGMFYGCYSLKHVPQLDTSNVTSTANMFYCCRSLINIPNLDLHNVTTVDSMFRECSSLKLIPELNLKVCTDFDYFAYYCYNLVSVKNLDISSGNTFQSWFGAAYNLRWIELSGLNGLTISLNYPIALEKSSLLYIINNCIGDSTIILKDTVYNVYSSDPDIIAALENNPHVSLSK